jgi:hypothetical protein
MGGSIAKLATATRELCEAALEEPALREAGNFLAKRNLPRAAIGQIVGAVSEEKSSLRPLQQLRDEFAPPRTGDPPILERVLLLNAALAHLADVRPLPVPDSVKALFFDEFRFFAEDPGAAAPRFAIGNAAFGAMCKIASLRRFPAGQFHWEISGVRRSDVLAVRPRQLPATLAFAALRMRGFGPVFFSHLNWRRPHRSLLEDEALRSYHRMAKAIEQQPAVKGFAACSWFRSPGTHAVSPHLAWLSRVFVENGGFVIEAGPDDPEGGALYRSKTRRQLFEAGRFKPTKGLVMWPRQRMIDWAAAHPELDG